MNIFSNFIPSKPATFGDSYPPLMNDLKKTKSNGNTKYIRLP